MVVNTQVVAINIHYLTICRGAFLYRCVVYAQWSLHAGIYWNDTDFVVHTVCAV